MDEVAYDHEENPRSLHSVPNPADVAAVEAKVENISEQIQVINKVIGTFGSKGWEVIKHQLVTEMVKAKQWCANPDKTPDLPDLRYVQGQIKAYQYLLGLGDEAAALKNFLVAERRNLLGELGEEPEAVADGVAQ